MRSTLTLWTPRMLRTLHLTQRAWQAGPPGGRPRQEGEKLHEHLRQLHRTHAAKAKGKSAGNDAHGEKLHERLRQLHRTHRGAARWSYCT